MARVLRRLNVGTEIRHPLLADPDVVFVLRVPGNSEFLDWQMEGGHQRLNAMIHGVIRMEGHPDSAAFGAPGTAERRAYVDAMDAETLLEVSTVLDQAMRVSDDERKN